MSQIPAVPVDAAREPQWVRTGSAQTKRDYTAALAFEQMLTQQLTQTMTETSGLGAEGEGQEGEGSAAGSGSLLSALMPQGLAAQQNSFGIAEQLTRAQLPPHDAGAQPSGGVAA